MVMPVAEKTELDRILEAARKFREKAETTTLRGILSKHFEIKPDKPYFLKSAQAKAFGFDIPEDWQLKAFRETTDEGDMIKFSEVAPSGWEVAGEDLLISPEGKRLTLEETREMREQFPEWDRFWKQQTTEVPAMPPEPSVPSVEPPKGFVWDADTGTYFPANFDLEITKKFYQERPELLPKGISPALTVDEMDVLLEQQETRQKELVSTFSKVLPDIFSQVEPERQGEVVSNLLSQLESEEMKDWFATRLQETGRTPDTESLLKQLGFDEEKITQFYGTKETEIDVEAIVKGEAEAPTSPEIEAKKSLWNTFYGALRKATYQTEQGFNILLTRLPLTPLERQQFSQSMLQNKATFNEWVKKHPEIEPPAEVAEFQEQAGKLPFFQQLGAYIKNPQAAAYTIAGIAPPTLAALATFSGVSFLTGGNIILGGAAAYFTVAPMQIADVAEDLINAGAPEEQAFNLAVPVGALISGLEIVGDIPLLKAISPALKPFSKGLQKVLVDKVMLTMIKRGLVTFTTQEFTETLTEVAQQVIQDYTVSYFDKRNPFENINQTAVQTLIGVAPFALFGGAVSASTVRNGQPMKLTEIYNESLAVHKKEGLTDQEARVQALNDVAKTPEGETAIKKAYDELVSGVKTVIKEERGEIGKPEEQPIKPEVPEAIPVEKPAVPEAIPPKAVTPEVTGRNLQWRVETKTGVATVTITKEGKYQFTSPYPESKRVLFDNFDDAVNELAKFGDIKQVDMTAKTVVPFTKPTIPTAEAGQPEAGLQPSMLGEAPIEVRPKGKGKIAQISMEDQLKLEQARREVAIPEGVSEEQKRAYEAQAELETTKEWLQSEPASKLTNLIKKTGWSKGEVNNLTLKQYRDLTGKQDIKPNILTKDKKHVRWEYSLDEIATEYGYESSDALKEAIERTGKAQARIKELEAEVARLPVPVVEPSVKVQDIPLSVLDATSLTREEVEMTLQLFSDSVQSKELATQRAATIELRKRVLARRASQAKARAEELVVEGKTPGDAVKQAESEFMSGKLPTVDSQFMVEVSDEMRTVLEAKVYDYWQNVEPNWFELMSTIDALHNALRTGNIPRKKGTGSKAFPQGGSAYDRLSRVFGGQPEVLLALDKGKPFEDIVEGVFRMPEQEPTQLDQDMLDYMRSLSTVPKGQAELLAWQKSWETPTPEDIRTAAEKEYSLRKLQLDTMLAEKKISKDNYDIELAIAKEKAYPYPAVTQYAPPVNDALKASSLMPLKHRHLMVRALQEIGGTATDIGNFLRANLASFDFSWWRQAAPMIMNNLDSWMLGNIQGWKAIWSKKAAESAWAEIIHDPLYQIYDELGLDFLRPLDLPKGTKQWQGVEEFGFLGTDRPIPKLTEAIPWVKVSQRVFVSGINRMLWNNFEKFYKSQVKVSERIARGDVKLKAGESFSIKENMRQFGRMMEDMSGRAQLGKASAIAPAANAMFFSLRLNLGRLLTPRHLVSSNKYVRAEAWKNLTTFVGTMGGVILMGAVLGWWDVERDPRSADFMKIRIGNIRVDPWGGYQQFVVFATRILMETGLVSATGAEYQVDPLGGMVNFLRGKASPLLSILIDFKTGRNFMGDKVDVANLDQWLERIAPFALRDIWDAFTEKGIEGALIGLPAFFGANVITYSNKWDENAKKLGLQKYDDLVLQGIKGPNYTIEDFWSDHAAEFKGVEPNTLTEKKGFHPRIKALAEAQQVRETVEIIPNVKLTSINADPEKGDTLEKYYAQWGERQKLVKAGDKAELTLSELQPDGSYKDVTYKGEAAVKAFDKRNGDAKLGNMTQTQFVLLREYHTLSPEEQKQFVKDHPEIGINPRQEWLRTHPKENALLAIHGQTEVLTEEAYKNCVRLYKELDYPEAAWSSKVPPEKFGKSHFAYLKAEDEFSAASAEAKLVLAQNPDYAKWKGLNVPEQPVRYYELQTKNREQREYWASLGDKEQPDTYIDDIKERRTKFLEKYKNSEYFDDEARVEAIANKFPDGWIESWVAKEKQAREFGGNSPQIKVWAFENPEAYRHALKQELMSDRGGLPTVEERGLWVEWSYEASKLRVKNTDELKFWNSLGDKEKPTTYIEDIKKRWAAFDKKFPNSDLRLDLERIEAFDKFFTPEEAQLWAKRGDISFEYGAASPETKAFMLDHPDLHKKALKAGLLTAESEEWNEPAIRISVKYRKEDAEYQAILDKYPGRPPEEVEFAKAYLAGNKEYRLDRYRRDAYTLNNTKTGYKFPATQVENFVAFNELPMKGKRRDRYLIDNPEFAKAMQDVGRLTDIPKKVPDVRYDEIYEQYQTQFDQYDNMGIRDTAEFIEDKDARDKARQALLIDRGKITDFGRARYEQEAYEKYVPQKYVARYTDWRSLNLEGIPTTWAKDSKGNSLTWYEDDWYLMEHPAFYEDIYIGLLELEKRDFSKVPSRIVWDKYVKYLSLIEGKPRDDFRYQNKDDLDKWLLLTKQVTVPITEKVRRANLSPAEKRKAELKEIEELLK